MTIEDIINTFAAYGQNSQNHEECCSCSDNKEFDRTDSYETDIDSNIRDSVDNCDNCNTIDFVGHGNFDHHCDCGNTCSEKGNWRNCGFEKKSIHKSVVECETFRVCKRKEWEPNKCPMKCGRCCFNKCPRQCWF